ncbi:MAG TPA: 1-deoxy-D-xylulose-5-phosphate synthase [Pseudothermotoga sp.]|nr:1-deoxy-D-xylulose-5-phosphate synthase [Pseudothermotoga sp.]HOK83279.1 1-deoxy-D-xylulose-5-phosphate synthase [Pseudothermotoga sp.]HPP70105.1 1-deoxy-D-xylulose-5-phosphate synthase [Pseudothermotoga sp.]
MNLDDVVKADISKLTELSKILRDRIIQVVSLNGGHLASNLGVVELTLALYSVFDPRQNVIIWDTSHQCYTHKLLTGRWNEFSTLRQFGGVSGYASLKESELDRFGAGHAGTSIAAALGIEKALRLKKEQKNVLVVIGDGALTNGEALESLNQLKAQDSKIKIILNDNGMSIAPNVGALSETFMKLRTSPAYVKFKQLVKKVLEGSEIGRNFEDELKRIRESMKQFIYGPDFFESLGLKHIGPIDGHDLQLMRTVFERIKHYDYPVVVHVITQKGKGYEPAEKDSVSFHSAPKFDLESGEPLRKQGYISYSEVFGETMLQLAQKDERVFAITAAMPDGTGLKHFSQTFPERFADLGITEQSCVTFAAGLSVAGLKPFVAIYSTFLQRAYDQIVHDVALQNLNVVFAIDRAGLVGEDGPTHHGLSDIALFRTVPKSIIFAPINSLDLVCLLRSIVENDTKGVIAVRYPKDSEEVSFEELWAKSKIIDPFTWEIARKGNGKVAILAVGTMVKYVDRLVPLDPTVVHVRCVKPLDEKTLSFLVETHDSFVTIEEGFLSGGFGESIISFMNQRDVRKPVLTLGVPEEFIPQGSREQLLRFCKLDSESISQAVVSFLKKEVYAW